MRHTQQNAERIRQLVRHHLPRYRHGHTGGFPGGAGTIGFLGNESHGTTALALGNTTAAIGGDIGSSGGGPGARDGALTDTIKEAASQLAQWRASNQAQQELLSQNTAALQQNTSAQSKTSAAGSVLKTASSFLSGGLGAIPLLSGILHLFGGKGTSASPLLKYNIPPPSLQFEQGVGRAGSSSPVYDQYGTPRTASAAQSPSTPQQNITVNVHAMDSRGFLDHSVEIAHAVKDAMLNLHSINDVVNQL